MKALLRLLSLLIGLLAIILFRWVTALVGILRDLWQKIKRWLERRALTERERKATDAPCVPINQEAVHRPDPLIYSQYDLMARGYAVTWDNPDIGPSRSLWLKDWPKTNRLIRMHHIEIGGAKYKTGTRL